MEDNARYVVRLPEGMVVLNRCAGSIHADGPDDAVNRWFDSLSSGELIKPLDLESLTTTWLKDRLTIACEETAYVLAWPSPPYVARTEPPNAPAWCSWKVEIYGEDEWWLHRRQLIELVSQTVQTKYGGGPPSMSIERVKTS